MQIIKDVFLLSGHAYGLHPNVYAVRGTNGLVMIDSGLDEIDLSVIDRSCREWGLDKLPITHLLLTHAHFDHSGNAQILRQRGAVVVAGPSDAEGIEAGDDRTIPYAYGRMFPACKVDIRVSDGDTIHSGELVFSVIHVPGHSNGSVFYRLEKNGKVILFTGDVVRVKGNCEGALLGWSGGIDYNPDLYMKSLARIAKMECDILLGGHFHPCLKDGYKILQNAYMRALLDFRKPSIYE